VTAGPAGHGHSLPAQFAAALEFIDGEIDAFGQELAERRFQTIGVNTLGEVPVFAPRAMEQGQVRTRSC